jgi:hypothetical protein
MAMDLGSAVLRMGADSSGLFKELDKAEVKAHSWAKSIGNALGTVGKLAGGLAVAGVAGLGPLQGGGTGTQAARPARLGSALGAHGA